VENVTTNLRSLLFPAPHQIMKSNAQSVRNFSPIGNYLPQQYQLDIPTVLQVRQLSAPAVSVGYSDSSPSASSGCGAPGGSGFG